MRMMSQFQSAETLVATMAPSEPVYCFHPEPARAAAKLFLEEFPGDTLFAVKTNPSKHILNVLYDAGITHFDTASIAEIALVNETLHDPTCYFMHPVKSREAIEAACRYGVDTFIVDCSQEIAKIDSHVPSRDGIVIVVRLATSHASAHYELSSKFGASKDEAVELLEIATSYGYQVGVAFHVGSQIMDTDAYKQSLLLAKDVCERANVSIVCLDVGGGFPGQYGMANTPTTKECIDEIVAGSSWIPEDCRLLCEPGRGLSVEAESLITQVHLRKDDSIYLNDGLYGSLVDEQYRLRLPHRMVRSREFSSEVKPFTVFGPTCDSIDVFSSPLYLPENVSEGDWIEFGRIGAYGSACRSHFNGFFPDTFVEVEEEFDMADRIIGGRE